MPLPALTRPLWSLQNSSLSIICRHLYMIRTCGKQTSAISNHRLPCVYVIVSLHIETDPVSLMTGGTCDSSEPRVGPLFPSFRNWCLLGQSEAFLRTFPVELIRKFSFLCSYRAELLCAGFLPQIGQPESMKPACVKKQIREMETKSTGLRSSDCFGQFIPTLS